MSTCKIDQIMKKEKFDTSPDPDPEWLFECNRKCAPLPALYTSLSITLIRLKISELQTKEVCI